MLKLSIKCTRFESNYSSPTGRSSNICNSSNSECRRSGGKRKDRIPPKKTLMEKLVWVPVSNFSFCKIFIPSCAFDLMPYYVETGCSGPPNHETLRRTPLYNSLGLIEMFFRGPRGCRLEFRERERERERERVCVFVRGKQQLLQDGVR
jgi:hypothetical protein